VPAVAAPPIAVRPLQGGLLGVARALPSDIDWMDGLSFVTSCPDGGGGWACEPPAGAIQAPVGLDPTPVSVKNSEASGDVAEFNSFFLYRERYCEGPYGAADVEALAANEYTRLRTHLLARELHKGDLSGVGNPTLQNSATDKTPGGGAQSLPNSLQALVDLVCQRSDGDVIIHAPISSLPQWIALDLLTITPTGYSLGLIPVSFDCYPNESPAGVPAPTGEHWFYASGTVEVAGSRIETTTGRDGAARQNIYRAQTEQLNILRFDPCNILAVRARTC